VSWRPFDLHPEYPPEGISRAELIERYGPGFTGNLARMFDEAGLPHSDELTLVPNSKNALKLGERARDLGRFDELHPRIFGAYWAEARDIGDDEVLVELAAAAGISEEDARSAFASDELEQRVEQWTQAALELGANGVPAWLVDERLLVPGAQPHEVFERVLERLGHQPVAIP
jgi:predicted DsbA family dithiol-disulfide isomerase